jgi:hypothetical protein
MGIISNARGGYFIGVVGFGDVKKRDYNPIQPHRRAAEQEAKPALD